jgi:hypothetical protein
MLPVESPFKTYTGTDGKPLDGGYVYFGQANQNPITSPVTVYWDAAGTQPAAQPLRTVNGYIMRAGTPANVFFNGSYSELVQDSKQRQVFYARTSDDFSIATVVSNFISSLASSVGSSLIGFIQAGANALLRTVQAKLRETVSTADYATLADAVTAVNVGGTVYIEGAVTLTTPYVQTKRVNLICRGYDDYILLNVGTGNDGMTFQGNASGLNSIDLKLNVYGQASACRNAVVLSRVDRSDIDLNVRAGATGYAVVLDGVLLNDIYIESTTNYSPPISSPGTQVDHVLIQKNTTYAVATNANDIQVCLEGARHGIVGTDQNNEGMNKISGCIEGLSGRPFDVTNHYNVHVTNMWMEANLTKSRFTNCKGPHIGPGVTYINVGDAAGTLNEIDFIGCRGVVIDQLAYGGANFDTGCTTPTIRQGATAVDGKYTGEGNGNSAETLGPVIATDTIAFPNQMWGGFGSSTQENLFHNPFIDIWTLGAAASPDGLPPVNATSVQVTTPLYPRNGSRFANKVTVTVGGSGNGVHIVPKAPYLTYAEDRWVSLAIAIYVASGQPEVRVFAIGGIILGTVTAKDQWVVVRGSCKVAANTALEFWCPCYNTGTASYVTGEYYIGAVNIVNGSHVPKYFGDHGKRSEYIVTSVANTPSFVGQRALAAGKWYMAGGTTSSADWLILN